MEKKQLDQFGVEELSLQEKNGIKGGSEFSDWTWQQIGAGMHYFCKGLYLLGEGAGAIKG